MVDVNNLLASYAFKVDFIVPGLLLKEVSFNKVSSIGASAEEFSGNDSYLSSFSSGKVTYKDLELERAFETGKASFLGIENSLTNWVEIQLLSRTKFPIPLIVHALNKENKLAVSWTCTDAYPVDYEIDGFDSVGNGLVTEKFTFRYKRFIRYEHSSLLEKII